MAEQSVPDVAIGARWGGWFDLSWRPDVEVILEVLSGEVLPKPLAERLRLVSAPVTRAIPGTVRDGRPVRES